MASNFTMGEQTRRGEGGLKVVGSKMSWGQRNTQWVCEERKIFGFDFFRRNDPSTNPNTHYPLKWIPTKLSLWPACKTLKASDIGKL